MITKDEVYRDLRALSTSIQNIEMLTSLKMKYGELYNSCSGENKFLAEELNKISKNIDKSIKMASTMSSTYMDAILLLEPLQQKVIIEKYINNKRRIAISVKLNYSEDMIKKITIRAVDNIVIILNKKKEEGV